MKIKKIGRKDLEKEKEEKENIEIIKTEARENLHEIRADKEDSKVNEFLFEDSADEEGQISNEELEEDTE